MTTTTVPRWASPYTARALTDLPADLTTATPPQIDEALRTIDLDRVNRGADLDQALAQVRRAVGQTESSTRVRTDSGWRTVTTWDGTESEALAAARRDPAAANADWDARIYRGLPTVGDALAAADAIRADLDDARDQANALHAEYERRDGWTRYYRVDNTGGHVHTTTLCRTTYATTAWTWPTQLSGADPAQVVDAAGPLTCLACFPGEREDILAARPVRFDAFETAEQRDARLDREAAATARSAARIAKGVTPDGSPLRVTLSDAAYRSSYYGPEVVVKTLRAAELRYVELAADAQRDRYTREEQAGFRAAADELLAAIVWKRGQDAGREMTRADVEPTFLPKIAKKVADISG